MISQRHGPVGMPGTVRVGCLQRIEDTPTLQALILLPEGLDGQHGNHSNDQQSCENEQFHECNLLYSVSGRMIQNTHKSVPCSNLTVKPGGAM